MRNFRQYLRRSLHPYHRSPWVDVATVVFVLALILTPAAFLATALMGGSGGGGSGGGVVASGGGSGGAVASGSGSAFSAWKQRQAREGGNPLVDTGPFGASAAGTTGRSAAPFSSSWRAQARPELSGGGTLTSGGVTEGTASRFGSGIQSSGSTSSYGGSGRSASGSGRPRWAAEARRFSSQALALSRQLGRVASDPVDRSLSEQVAPSEASSGGASAEGPTSSATSNPPTPQQPTLPIDDHVHWLLAAGLLWGVWRLCRGA